MRTNFGIKNFRIFGEGGASFDIKPITILTGENSSGKSTLVKAMILLKNYFASVKNEPTQNPAAVQLDFTDPTLKMSGFNSALSKISPNSSVITFSYEASSDFAPFKFNVEYAFVKDEDNDSKGELRDIKIKYKGNTLAVFSNVHGKLQISEMDVRKFTDALLIFLKGVEFHKSTRTFEDDSLTKVVKAISKSGIDITDWEKYQCESFLSRSEKDTIRNTELVSAIKKVEETGVFFYFPIIDELAKLGKVETINKLENSKADYLKDRWQNLSQIFEICKKSVIEDFKNSSCNSFVDYLRKIEDEAFDAFKTTSCPSCILGVSKYLSALFDNDIFKCFTFDSWDLSRRKSDTIQRRVFTFLHLLHFSSTPESDDFLNRYISPLSFTDSGQVCDYAMGSSHHLLNALTKFLPLCITELICPNIFDGLTFVGSSFTPVQRLHSFEEESNLVILLKEYKRLSRIVKQNTRTISPEEENSLIVRLSLGAVDYKIGEFVNKWLNTLGIAKELLIKESSEGLGFKIYLNKGRNNLTSLADEGRGITQIVLILLQIEVELMKKSIRTAGLYNAFAVDVAYPTLAIEEPEVSLHPCWQSILADIFLDANKSGIHFILETHSEYLIRKTQAIVANYKTEQEYEHMPFVVYYIERDGSAYDLEYTESGRFAKSFGPGFFDESSRSNVEILKRERRMQDEA